MRVKIYVVVKTWAKGVDPAISTEVFIFEGDHEDSVYFTRLDKNRRKHESRSNAHKEHEQDARVVIEGHDKHEETRRNTNQATNPTELKTCCKKEVPSSLSREQSS